MVKRIFYYSRSNKSFIFQLLSILISLIIFVLSIITLNYEQLAIWQILSSMLFLALLFELGFGNIFLIKIKQSIDNKKSKDFFETMPKLKHTVKVANPKTKKTSDVILTGLSDFFA